MKRAATALVHQDALDGGAALPGVLVRAGGGERGRLLEVGVLHDDDRVVAAELEHLALVDGPGGDVLADGDAAGKGHQVHVGVREQLVGDLARIAGEHAEHRRRQARLIEDVREQQRAQRGLLGGLEDHAVVGRDARARSCARPD